MADDPVRDCCNELESIYEAGSYPLLEVTRPWSRHNPKISGELARPAALRTYLLRELSRLVQMGATLSARPSRPRLLLTDPAAFAHVDESMWNLKQKKLFLFPAERMEISLDRLAHYTGTRAEDFQRYVVFTNYDMHTQSFVEKFPDCVQPRAGVQMPAFHHVQDDQSGITLINIGVGPSNAKTITDHVAVLRPDLWLMIGHCGGLRNHQEVGDFVLALAYMRADGVLDQVLPQSVPIISNHHVNVALLHALSHHSLPRRIGTVYTTANRNWEFNQRVPLSEIELSRAIAVDMESATIATNGFRYRVPASTLLCVSDKPLHGSPKAAAAARDFYEASKRQHVDLAVEAIDSLRSSFPDGIPNDDLRSTDEPLMGGPPDEK